jgi:hypothetical protein
MNKPAKPTPSATSVRKAGALAELQYQEANSGRNDNIKDCSSNIPNCSENGITV